METTLSLTLPTDANNYVPYFSEWTGVWMMEYRAFDALVTTVSKLDIAAHIAIQAAAMQGTPRGDGGNRVDYGSVAVIHLEGALQKHASSMGSSRSSTVMARRSIREAASDPMIGAILLKISSPGGTSSGTQELFDDVAKAGLSKPVVAFCDDLCASAAYWVASGSSRIIANASALVGSIGTYAVVQDYSSAAAKEGIKVSIVKAGAFKGMGTAGTEVTPEQLAEIQRLVDSRNDFFLAGVQKGRKMPKDKVDSLADGRIHPANEALSMGLIDSIGSFDDALAETLSLAEQTLNKSKKVKSTMSESSQATVQSIKAACPGAGSDFVLKALESGWDDTKATTEYAKDVVAQNASLTEAISLLKQENAKLSTELGETKAKLEDASKLPTGKIGVSALNEPTKTESTSATGYWGLVKAQQAAGMNRRDAMMFVNKNYPEAREQMTAEANLGKS